MVHNDFTYIEDYLIPQLDPVNKEKKELIENVSSSQLVLKRLFDILVALFVIICICSWLFPIIAMLIKFDSRGSVFYKQFRKGLYGKDFLCWKFRTMYLYPNKNYKPTEPNDVRITSMGKMLRKTSFDELPQVINVLLGDMSIVGPRPLPVEECICYEMYIANFSQRHWVKPGITGLAQVKGLRGNAPNFEENKKRIIKRTKYDIYYIINLSLLLDIKIIMLTVRNMINGDENAR